MSQVYAIRDELYAAMTNRVVVEPLTNRFPDMTVDDAYQVSEELLKSRIAAGESLVGRKIGLTSEAVQRQLGVNEPDFGSLTSDMMYPNGADVPISERLIQPKVEGEIAFVLRSDLAGPRVTQKDVLDATDYVMPCFEIVDSRIRDWNIKLVDTIADNASCGLFVLGGDRADPRALDLSACVMNVRADGQVVAEGAGAAALGSPLTCVAWLANSLSRYGISLRAGQIVLSGSLVPFLPVVPRQELTVSITSIGTASLRFT